ncbi:hypothetical protein [Paenibacillus planticolens]|uniref:Uncharacterized protein n=1 Tax=Paenibacillus planticolens TaxID=2654976 RepID=A0ABX1ZFE1_9BACL|nr:hypothetical protein [Paenibacillus planticolens]NOU98813.1 hypothetical protein [Paenibacillus planticolens]
MVTFSSFPSHLSLFITHPDTGLPTSNLPIYAEIAIPRVKPALPPNTKFREPMIYSLLQVDSQISTASRNFIVQVTEQALVDVIAAVSLNSVKMQDGSFIRDFLIGVFKDVLNSVNAARFDDIPQSELKSLIAASLKDNALRIGLMLVEQPEDRGMIWAEPLGVLTTDHVGYVSFDLRRLQPEVKKLLSEAIELRRTDPGLLAKTAILVYPYGVEQRFDVLSQARFSMNAIVARLSVNSPEMLAHFNNMGPRSLQNPSLTDWQLSPTSFAASPKTLVGEDGCDSLVPSNMALQQFVLRQVVRLTDAPEGFDVPVNCKPAYIDEYKVSWYSLGHSLGELLYSLPLAPAETVKLAVIDWSWDSLTKRDENTTLNEQLLHQTHRDRTITETMKAGLKELQHGSLFMGGAAHSSGGTGSFDMGILDVGAAVGDTWSMGGSTATSDGSRDLAAENIQRLSDSFSQASSAQRELNSTVVIQARQEEKESIQTRTFTNYNHSHTLTILYYEVLRHFRVTVEWVRRRPALLIKLPKQIDKFDDNTLIAYRNQLEPALLDPKLKTAFDALEKREAIREYQKVNNITPAPEKAAGWEGDLTFGLFEFGVKTAEGLRDKTDELVMVNLITWDGANVGRPLLHLWEKGAVTDNVDTGERLNDTAMGWFIAKPDVPVAWSNLVGFEFVLHDTDEWRLDRLHVNGFFAGGVVPLIENADVDYYFSTNGSSNTMTYIKRPGPRPSSIPPVLSPEASLTVEETYAIKKLKDHFDSNHAYYNRLLLLGNDSNSIALQMEKEAFADIVDPTPLEVFGSYVAYPLAKKPKIQDWLVVDLAVALNSNDPNQIQWATNQLAQFNEHERELIMERIALASVRSERLITLPTRGVFAEGKLGHCNVSEEIDNTRFWKWEEHPIPFAAPDINPITAVQPQPQVITPTPTAFPQSLVNIVNPTSAPDPTGLAAALNLLGTPNIFRDMSGQQQVADLLKKLSDNTIDIAEAANKAREIQKNYQSNLDKQQKDYDLGIYKTAAEVEGKAIEAEAQKAAQAHAAKAEAEAKQATVEAAKQQAEAAKSLPPSKREPVYQAAAQSLAGNPVKDKLIIFKTQGYNGQVIPGEFILHVRDVLQQKFVIASAKVNSYHSQKITFSDAEPVLDAEIVRAATTPIVILDETFYLPAIDILTPESYSVGKSHKVINLTLKQASRDVAFKAKSTNAAVDELMNKWGVELGVSKVVAAKMVADYEQKHQITHGTEEEKSYTFNVPTQNYELKFSSK